VIAVDDYVTRRVVRRFMCYETTLSNVREDDGD
jgi:hypothetical protein